VGARARAARKPRTHSAWKRRKGAEARPPPGSSSCAISWLSLNAALSKRMLPPGEISRMKPKSMCTRRPRPSSRMLPLCRSLACSRKHATAYLARAIG